MLSSTLSTRCQLSKVVHCKKDSFDIYIGRPSPYGNPYELGKDGTRKEVIEKYKRYLYNNPQLQSLIRENLDGKILGCWCSPKSCHGDVIVQFLKSSQLEF